MVQSNCGTGWTAAAVVAACALFFTVFSFWWVNARRGRLKSFPPHTFAFYIDSARVRLRLPLVLYNTGAAPIIVQNLRLSFPEQSDSANLLYWITSRVQIKPSNPEDYAFPAVFSVAGRSAQQFFVEFGEDSLGFALDARPYSVRVEAKLGHKKKWWTLLDFTVQAAQIVAPGKYITYENTSPPQERRREAETALKNYSPNRRASRGRPGECVQRP